MSLEQKRRHWFDADDNEYYVSELRTAAAVYIAALEAELAALKADRLADLPGMERLRLLAELAALIPVAGACPECGIDPEELAALKGRRCDECDSREGQSHYCLLLSINTGDAFYCDFWTARAEEGGE